MIALSVLQAPAVRHAFFDRSGGVSEGLYASLNCGFGSGDDEDKVALNRAIAMDGLSLPPDALVTVRQVHSSDVVTVERPWPRTAAPTADAMVTRAPGVALGILTADCAPVLFADPDAGVIGAAHAGWRGALGGVLEATIEAMERLGAARGRIRAAVGPCIGPESYEVGDDFRAAFHAAGPSAHAFFRPHERPGKHRFDLPGFVAARLRAAGLAAVEGAGRDTLAEEERYFSFRRNTLAGTRTYGRLLSAVALA